MHKDVERIKCVLVCACVCVCLCVWRLNTVWALLVQNKKGIKCRKIFCLPPKCITGNKQHLFFWFPLKPHWLTSANKYPTQLRPFITATHTHTEKILKKRKEQQIQTELISSTWEYVTQTYQWRWSYARKSSIFSFIHSYHLSLEKLNIL